MSQNFFSRGQPVYVLDTNIIIDYPGAIPGIRDGQPEEPTVDLSDAHIVIPMATIRELASFKKEKSDRSAVARKTLKKLRKMFGGSVYSLEDNYNLNASISPNRDNQQLSIFSVDYRFKDRLPFQPSDDDMDGQIILTALAIKFIMNGISVDGSGDIKRIMACKDENNLVILTNDNELALRAHNVGIRTKNYGYKLPNRYTGRREVVVDEALLLDFYESGEIELDLWKAFMSSEPDLVANEFIIMQPENPSDFLIQLGCQYNNKFKNIGRYDALSRKIVGLNHLKDFPLRILNNGQAIYAEALMNPDIAAVICTGPAGTGKTFMPTIYGISACKKGKFIGVTVVPCESHSKLGALPGGINAKMDPDVQPLKNAIRNYLIRYDKQIVADLRELKQFGARLPRPAREALVDDNTAEDNRSLKQKIEDRVDAIWRGWFTNLPIESARGRDFAYELAIYDEFQDQNRSQADTLIKRIGADGKIVITGDIKQIHAPYLDQYNNGIVYAERQLFDNPMVAQICLNKEEVIRHPLVKMIAKRQDTDENN